MKPIIHLFLVGPVGVRGNLQTHSKAGRKKNTGFYWERINDPCSARLPIMEGYQGKAEEVPEPRYYAEDAGRV